VQLSVTWMFVPLHYFMHVMQVVCQALQHSIRHGIEC
jgi:hypothetical protein